eukprot:6456911-Amphidinium_carterae.1
MTMRHSVCPTAHEGKAPRFCEIQTCACAESCVAPLVHVLTKMTSVQQGQRKYQARRNTQFHTAARCSPTEWSHRCTAPPERPNLQTRMPRGYVTRTAPCNS